MLPCLSLGSTHSSLLRLNASMIPFAHQQRVIQGTRLLELIDQMHLRQQTMHLVAWTEACQPH